jgi:quercetin dioxygenase-like cupin family protein
MSNAMTQRPDRSLAIHVTSIAGPPQGWVHGHAGTRHAFSGWLGLMGVLEDQICPGAELEPTALTGGSEMSVNTQAPPAPIALQRDEGESYWFFGQLVTIKAAADTTAGRAGITECLGPRGTGSPLHVHSREDEWFYVLEGELTLWVGGTTHMLPAGAFAYGPQGVPHTFAVTSETAHFLLVVNPGGFESFIRAVGEPAGSPTIPPQGDTEPDPAQFAAMAALAAEHGVEIIGPPGIPA